MPILLLSCGIFVDEHCTLFIPGIQRCPSDSSLSIHEVEINSFLDLDGNAFWMFRIPISFIFQAGVFLRFATLQKYAYGSILMIGYRRFAVAKQTMDFIHALFSLTARTVSHL